MYISVFLMTEEKYLQSSSANKYSNINILTLDSVMCESAAQLGTLPFV